MKKMMKKITSIILAFVICFSILSINTILAEEQKIETTDVFADLAFPTAEGFGKYVDGFRGGKVVAVTNLNPMGEGSLRWALEEVDGPRIVVFKVCGVIDLTGYYPIEIKDGNVYVAGQTAPGDGVTIVGSSLYISKASNVVVRDLKIRKGSSMAVWGFTCIQINKCDNVIIDSCSISWGACSNIYVKDSKKVTVQNCILSEPISYMGQSEYLYYGIREGSGIELDGENYSIHKNLITNTRKKVFAFSYSHNGDNYYGEKNNNIDIRNNVVYNFENSSVSGDLCKNMQFVNNYYKKGEGTRSDILLNINGMGYISDNKLVDNKGEVIVDSNDENPWVLVSEESFPDGRSNEPLFDSNVNTMTADETYEYVIANAGANASNRDYIDSRYINEVVNGTHTYSSYGTPGIIYDHQHAEGYPDNTTLRDGEAPLDTDNDGMPDEWELLHGLNPNDYYDACQVYLSDEGYTNIELYINELAGDPVKYSDNPTIQYNPVTPTPEPTETPVVTKTPEVTTTPEISATIVPTDIPYVTGDVNADGVVSADDALAVLKHAAKLELLTTEAQLRADVEVDNLIDAADALAILKIAAKIK